MLRSDWWQTDTISPSAKNAWIQESSFVIDIAQTNVNREVESKVRHYLSVILAWHLRFFAVWSGVGFVCGHHLSYDTAVRKMIVCGRV
jgi:hypothetical protein